MDSDRTQGTAGPDGAAASTYGGQRRSSHPIQSTCTYMYSTALHALVHTSILLLSAFFSSIYIPVPVCALLCSSTCSYMSYSLQPCGCLVGCHCCSKHFESGPPMWCNRLSLQRLSALPPSADVFGCRIWLDDPVAVTSSHSSEISEIYRNSKRKGCSRPFCSLSPRLYLPPSVPISLHIPHPSSLILSSFTSISYPQFTSCYSPNRFIIL